MKHPQLPKEPTRRRRGRPKKQSLSMDWFVNPAIDKVIHTVNSPLNNPPLEEGLSRDRSIYLSSSSSSVVESVDNSEIVDNFVDNFLEEDPRGCHSNLQEHMDGERMCAETMKGFGVRNPGVILRRWTTDEILTALDDMCGVMERKDKEGGYKIWSPGGWLWKHLSNMPQDKEDEKETF